MINDTELQAHPVHPARRPMSWLAVVAFSLALVVAIAGAMAGFGTRWNLWTFRTGFGILRYAAYGGIAVAVIAVAAALHSRPRSGRRGFILSFIALLIGLVTFGIPWQTRRSAAGAPPIHDITTDTDNPPSFVAVVPLRADAPNPPTYEGETIASQQRGAYPDIRPVVLDLPPDRAFQRALDAAEAMGWEIVDSNAAEGRIEATDQTFWFGFKDDVVIRVTPLEARSVVDVRSKSRVGRGDLSTNARHIRNYVERLNT